jgi:hypothetical protein
MAANRSPLLKVVSKVDAAVSPTLQSVAQHEVIGLALAVAVRLRRGVAQRAERASRHVLHTMNLPAGSDVRRLLTQISMVEREVRELNKAITDERQSVGGGRGEG